MYSVMTHRSYSVRLDAYNGKTHTSGTIQAHVFSALLVSVAALHPQGAADSQIRQDTALELGVSVESY